MTKIPMLINKTHKVFTGLSLLEQEAQPPPSHLRHHLSHHHHLTFATSHLRHHLTHYHHLTSTTSHLHQAPPNTKTLKPTSTTGQATTTAGNHHTSLIALAASHHHKHRPTGGRHRTNGSADSNDSRFNSSPLLLHTVRPIVRSEYSLLEVF
ncbi:homeobox protein B-H1-like [Helianthus annuus]|uniref:homeobox protein B-H1-like n=1 Tax=Helianthus annuus TaxID=4232 RepID=UPI000B8FCDE6|nr:homeobox protein B-H1-like [Helianthus annuus]